MDATAQEIAAWCQTYLAHLLAVPADQIGLDADFDRLGVDSALAVSLLTEVEERYGVDLAPEALFDDPSVGALARQVGARLRAGASPT